MKKNLKKKKKKKPNTKKVTYNVPSIFFLYQDMQIDPWGLEIQLDNVE